MRVVSLLVLLAAGGVRDAAARAEDVGAELGRQEASGLRRHHPVEGEAHLPLRLSKICCMSHLQSGGSRITDCQ